MKILATLSRFYVRNLEPTLPFYESLLRRKCSLRFSYPEAGLELARVGDILLLAGSEDALAPFADTRATFLVDDVKAWRAWLVQRGAVVIRDLRSVPTGWNLTVRHADGTQAEYVQHAEAVIL